MGVTEGVQRIHFQYIHKKEHSTTTRVGHNNNNNRI